jgi:hypothetical protein
LTFLGFMVQWLLVRFSSSAVHRRFFIFSLPAFS